MPEEDPNSSVKHRTSQLVSLYQPLLIKEYRMLVEI